MPLADYEAASAEQFKNEKKEVKPAASTGAPPMRFMAMAIVSCVSRLMAPSDMPPVQKRRRMSAAGSTSSIGMASPAGTSSRQSRSTCAGLASKCARYASYASCSTTG